MGLEEALELLGRLGRFQVLTFIAVNIVSQWPSFWQLYAIVFVGYPNKSKCGGKLPDDQLNESVPSTFDSLTNQTKYSECEQYVNLTVSNATEACTRFIFEPGEFDPDRGTIVQEWDLACDRFDYVIISQVLFGVGVMLGFIILAPFNDYMGRKTMMFFSLFCICMFGIAMSFSGSVEALIFFQFATGFFSANTFICGFVISCELFPTSLRSITAPLTYFFQASGQMTLILFAYFIRSWRELQFAISVTPLAFMLYWFFCPESLRWLVANGRLPETQRWLDIAAWVNRKKLPADILYQKSLLVAGATEISVSSKTGVLRPTLCKYLSHRKLVVYSLGLLYMICSSTLVYFGLSYLTVVLPGNIYVTFFFLGAMEIPGTFVSVIANYYVGRRYPLFVFKLLSASFLFISGLLSLLISKGFALELILVTIFMVLGKTCSAGCACIEGVYIQELYPTNLRGTAAGIVNGFGFIGGIVAPLALHLARQTSDYVVAFIFAGLTIVASFMALIEPETYLRDLPHTIEEVLSWPRTQSKEERAQLRERKKQRQRMHDDYIQQLKEEVKTKIGVSRFAKVNKVFSEEDAMQENGTQAKNHYEDIKKQETFGSNARSHI